MYSNFQHTNFYSKGVSMKANVFPSASCLQVVLYMMLKQGLSSQETRSSETTIYWKQQFALINHNISITTTGFTCFLTKSLKSFFCRIILAFCWFWDLIYQRRVFFDYHQKIRFSNFNIKKLYSKKHFISQFKRIST